MQSLLQRLLLGNAGGGGGGNPTLNYNFVDGSAFPSAITFTRASTATFFNSSGVLTSAGNDVPRLDYDPVTLAAQGLLIEEQRTNSIRNSTMQGAVAGTPGSSPTNWGATTSNPELALSVVGVGTESGIAYIDLRINGTVTAARTLTVSLETSNSVAAANGQTWIQSAYLRQVGGSQTNISSIYFQANTYTAAVAYVNSPWSASGLTVTTSGLATQRFTAFGTLSGATIAFIQPYIVVVTAASGAVDFTLRIGLPQLEQGAFATSVIPTTTTALTRNSDFANVNTLSPWYNATAGTVYSEFAITSTAPTSGFPTVTAFNNGTLNNRINPAYLNDSINALDYFVSDGGVTQAALSSSTYTAGSMAKMAAAYATNDFALSTNGGAVLTDTSGTIPSVTALNLGNQLGGNFLNGYIRRITYYPVRLTNAALQQITT